MGQERMSGLAFMHIHRDVDIDDEEVIHIFVHIHRDVDIDDEEVIHIFAQKKNRALAFLNICTS